MLFYLASGLILGLTAGIAPGPLLTLVISQALTYGTKEGIKVALAPLITDLPIVLLSLTIGSQIASNQLPLGLLSLAGACYICYLAWESLCTSPSKSNTSPTDAKSIQKGVLTNFLNPHPYLFWITVGTPLILKAWATAPWDAVVWMIAFYGMLTGSKILLSVLVGHSQKLLHGKGYIRLNRVLGLLLLFFAAMLAKDGLKLIGAWPG